MLRRDARRRYDRGILIASAVYGVSLVAGGLWFRHHPGSTDALAYALALVPGLSIAAIFAVIGRYLVEEADEYLRMLRTRQALIASALALSIATIWGFLEDFGLAPHVPPFWIAVLWFLGFAIGALVNCLAARR